MSKGPGKWQRLILRALAEHGAFYARRLLPEQPTAAQRAALSRAMRCLEREQRIEVDRYQCWSGADGRCVIRSPGRHVGRDAARGA